MAGRNSGRPWCEYSEALTRRLFHVRPARGEKDGAKSMLTLLPHDQRAAKERAPRAWKGRHLKKSYSPPMYVVRYAGAGRGTSGRSRTEDSV